MLHNGAHPVGGRQVRQHPALLVLKGTPESLRQALQLGETAEKLFPESDLIGHELRFAREFAVTDGLLPFAS